MTNLFALPKYHPGTGFLWKKKEQKRRKRSATDGKLKAETCKASSIDKHMAKSSRSYKHPEYSAWMEKIRKYH